MALNLLWNQFWLDILDTGTNRLVNTYWNDSTSEFVVQSWESFADFNNGVTPVTHVTGKTALSSDQPYLQFLVEQQKYNYYSPCVGTTLLEFFGNAEFPYNTKVETPDSPSCQVVICDLAIIQPIQTTPSDNLASANGTVTITASSTNGPVEFSLSGIGTDFLPADSVLGNEYTKTYTGLTPGIYTAYTRDGGGCTAQSQFEIGVIDDYVTKYFSTTRKNEKDLRINIKERGYSDQPIQVSWVSVRHRIGKLNDDLFKVIRGGSLDMTFIATVENELLDLATSDERQFLVEYLKDGELFFKGFLLTDLQERPLGPAPYNVTVSATDQLGTLKERDFTTRTGDLVTGFLSMLDVVRLCVAFTDLELPIISGANIYEVNESQTDADEPLVQQYVNTDQFQAVNCYDVLERILINYKLYQWDAQWYITPIAQTDPYYIRQFIDGIYQLNLLLDPVLELKRLGLQEAKSSVLGNKEAFLTQREPYSQVDITHDYGAESQIVPNGDFDLWESDTRPINWKGTAIQNGRVLKQAKADKVSDFILRLSGASLSETEGDFIETNPISFNYQGISYDESFKFFLRAQPQFEKGVGPETNLVAGLPLRIEINDGGTLYYLDNGGLISTDPNTRYTLQYFEADIGKFIDIEFDLVLPSSTNEMFLTLRLYQLYNAVNVSIDNIRFENVFINFFKNEGPIPTSETISLLNPGVNVSFRPEERTVFVGSIPNYINAKGVFNNGIFDVDGNVMRRWNRQGLTEQLDYAKIYGDNLLNTNIKRTNKITLRIADRQGGEMNYYNLLTKVDGSADEIKYIINAWDREEGSQIASLEIIELVKGFSVFESELPFRLLEDGEARILEDDAFRLLESE